ncbi:MAG: zinc ribbon domain-containing protein [Lachnospiraceae bacterium]|nr:zinc ribbon domain-containing protein [Lachnospiraceae bacterium]
MAFLDDLGKKISDVSESAVQKGKNMTDLSRYNSMISAEENNIKNIILQIGQTYYDKHADEADNEFAALFSQIKSANERISEYNEAVKRLKGIIKCPNCGKEVPNTSQFCVGCGTKLN